jgi:hypothetical protein
MLQMRQTDTYWNTRRKRSMSSYQRFLSLTFRVALSGLLLVVGNANAQEQAKPTPTAKSESASSSDGGWHAAITPYLYLAGLNGTVGALGHEASVHASAGDILSYVNIGAMGALELRYNRVVVPIDFMWIKFSDEKALTVEQGADSVKVKLNQTVFTPKIGYRVVDGKRFKADAVFGIRYWYLKNSLELQPVQVGNEFSDSAGWVDAVAGAKIETALTPKVVMTILGDAGGGSARSDYQIAGLLGLRVSRKVILQAGYRYMSVNYRPQSGFVLDLNQSGAVLGVTINLK